MSELIEQLVALVGERRVLVGDVLSERASSYWNSSPTQALALVKPVSTEEVSRVLACCFERDQRVVVQGGLTGVVAGAESSNDDVIISLERMNQIETIDERESVATVQAGVVLQTQQEELALRGLLFPLDLGPRGSCTIGGNVATNAGGISVLRYGMVRNLLLGLEVVLMDGTVMSSMFPMLKNNTGYDLKQLFVGSEGTLGVATRVMVRLFPLPTSRQSAMVASDSFDSVIDLLNQFRTGLAGTLSAFEVTWQSYYRGVTGENDHKPPMSRDYPFYMMVEAEGFDAKTDQARFESILESAFENGLIVDAIVPKSERERGELWLIREEFDPILPAYLYDVSLPIKHMMAYTQAIETRLASELDDARSVVFGHIADGNLHIFVTPYQDEQHHEAADAIIYSVLQEFGGSVSAEHGIGTEKIAWLNLNRSDEEINLMRAIKKSVDPKNLLNPGRLFTEESPI
ncbi:FAD-binding oxidoreductase [Pseudomonadales bacterium]|nr:FAD-binding oxidoreductase [Pseudomonadales bacterium]